MSLPLPPYTGTDALQLSGATIVGATSVAADVTLPVPGQPGSLSFNKNLALVAGESGTMRFDSGATSSAEAPKWGRASFSRTSAWTRSTPTAPLSGSGCPRASRRLLLHARAPPHRVFQRDGTSDSAVGVASPSLLVVVFGWRAGKDSNPRPSDPKKDGQKRFARFARTFGGC